MTVPSATPPNYAFASDNAAGLCPEALAALQSANAGDAPGYGADDWTQRAQALLRELFETDCHVFFVFNGTAANALALAACGRRPYTRVLCHELSHVDTDECGAPEFFSGGAKVTAVAGAHGKLTPADVAPALQRGHGIHYPKPAVLSLTQATELGTVYSPDELAALGEFARKNELALHVDGARFANAVAALTARGASLADVTWRAGVDVLCFGGTKNGMLTTEAVVFFNTEIAREFEYRVKQGGQLASKMRFAAAQWVGVLSGGAWLRHAAHANTMAQHLAATLRASGVRLLEEPQANGVFIELALPTYEALTARGWQFYRFIGNDGYRLMCSWATTPAQIEAFARDLRAVR